MNNVSNKNTNILLKIETHLDQTYLYIIKIPFRYFLNWFQETLSEWQRFNYW